MTQHVRELYHIPAGPIEDPGKQVAQVVWEHLGGRHLRLFADGFHLGPDLPPGHTFTGSGAKYLTGTDVLFFRVFQELAAQLAGQQDGADLPFQRDLRPPRLSGLHGDIPHLRDPDPGGANRLHQ